MTVLSIIVLAHAPLKFNPIDPGFQLHTQHNITTVFLTSAQSVGTGAQQCFVMR
jgi:hypothetical protein